MTLQHCIDLVREGDLDRYTVTRAASDAAQARLFPLYALNLEIARAAWASNEPLVAEMRLQWWRDAIERLCEGGKPPAHPVLDACDFLKGDAQAGMALDRLIEARRWDVWAEPFPSAEALWEHLEETSGALYALSARALGAADDQSDLIRSFGAAAGLAQWLQAVPELIRRERDPLPDHAPQAISALARDGLARLQAVRARRGEISGKAATALLAGWQASGLLRIAADTPQSVLRGGLEMSEFKRRGILALRAISGRW